MRALDGLEGEKTTTCSDAYQSILDINVTAYRRTVHSLKCTVKDLKYKVIGISSDGGAVEEEIVPEATLAADASVPIHLSNTLYGRIKIQVKNSVASQTAAITVFADAGSGKVTVTSAGHGLSNGDIVSITGTTSYNGTFTISGVTTDTFAITDTFVANDATGNWFFNAIALVEYTWQK